MGMNFLAVIGDVLGYKLLPRWVERKHFEIVVRCLVIEKTDVADLKRFYRLNINRLANRYELEGRRKVFERLLSKNICIQLFIFVGFEDITDEIEENLLELLSLGTKLAIEKGLLDKDCLKILNKSSKFIDNADFVKHIFYYLNAVSGLVQVVWFFV